MSTDAVRLSEARQKAEATFTLNQSHDAQKRSAKAASHDSIIERIAQQRALRLAKFAREEKIETPDDKQHLDVTQCRDRADAYGELAQKMTGPKREQLLDVADQWDELAEELEEENKEPAAPQKDHDGAAITNEARA
jgi:hypothetical protein